MQNKSKNSNQNIPEDDDSKLVNNDSNEIMKTIIE